MAKWAVTDKKVAVRLVCAIFRVSQCCYYYENRLNTENARIEEKILRLTGATQDGEFANAMSVPGSKVFAGVSNGGVAFNAECP